MENRNQSGQTPHPEKTGKVPASGVMSETYKEEVNPQDELGSSSNDPKDPEESNKSNEDDLDSYPLEEADKSAEKNIEKEREENNGQDINPSIRNDEFLK